MLTYASFLVIFVFTAIALLTLLNLIASRYGHKLNTNLHNKTSWIILICLMIIAFIYTTPWDNFLVASGVWFYRDDLVLGIIIGFVPLEEYTFFLVQTILTGLFIKLAGRFISMKNDDSELLWSHDMIPISILGIIWIISAILWVLQIPATIYFSLIIIWALPPIILQWIFGGDILRANWKLVLLSIITPTLYLSSIDYLAIASEIWTISPSFSTGILIGGVLAIEEVVFFLVTNVLVVLGFTLATSPISHRRGKRILKKIKTKL